MHAKDEYNFKCGRWRQDVEIMYDGERICKGGRGKDVFKMCRRVN
jgi:hypothetical protein